MTNSDLIKTAHLLGSQTVSTLQKDKSIFEKQLDQLFSNLVTVFRTRLAKQQSDSYEWPVQILKCVS